MINEIAILASCTAALPGVWFLLEITIIDADYVAGEWTTESSHFSKQIFYPSGCLKILT